MIDFGNSKIKEKIGKQLKATEVLSKSRNLFADEWNKERDEYLSKKFTIDL